MIFKPKDYPHISSLEMEPYRTNKKKTHKIILCESLYFSYVYVVQIFYQPVKFADKHFK
jgi:hypothetical protein